MTECGVQDGAIDPKEFTSILAWHKLKPVLPFRVKGLGVVGS